VACNLSPVFNGKGLPRIIIGSLFAGDQPKKLNKDLAYKRIKPAIVINRFNNHNSGLLPIFTLNSQRLENYG